MAVTIAFGGVCACIVIASAMWFAPRHDLTEGTMTAAQIRMKALVASRLMIGDIPNWAAFEKERDTAGMIANRR